MRVEWSLSKILLHMFIYLKYGEIHILTKKDLLPDSLQ